MASLKKALREAKAEDHVLRREERPGKNWVGFTDKTSGVWHHYKPGKRGTSRWKSEYRTPEARESFFHHGVEDES